jgi:hypothetical protein
MTEPVTPAPTDAGLNLKDKKVKVYLITTFQNSMLNLNGTEEMPSRATSNAHEVTNPGGRTITSPLTPLQARLSAAMRKPLQVRCCTVIQ